MKHLVGVSFSVAMVLLASQAFAFGPVVAAPHVGGVGVANVGHAGINVSGAVTVRGITVLPNGTMIVPAVTPRPQTVVVQPNPTGPIQMNPAPRSGNLGGKNVQPPYGDACFYESYYGICH